MNENSCFHYILVLRILHLILTLNRNVFVQTILFVKLFNSSFENFHFNQTKFIDFQTEPTVLFNFAYFLIRTHRL